MSSQYPTPYQDEYKAEQARQASAGQPGGAFHDRIRAARLDRAYGNARGEQTAESYWDALLRDAATNIGAMESEQRSALENSLEARGLGQSSLLERGMGRISRSAQGAMNEARTGVMGLRFQKFMADLNFQRQKELIAYQHELNDKPWWQDVLGAVGQLAPVAIGAIAGGPAGAAAGGAVSAGLGGGVPTGSGTYVM